MRTPRFFVTAAVAAAMALSGCGGETAAAGSGGDATAASPTAPADPAAQMASAVKDIQKGNHRYTFKGDGVSGEGFTHTASGAKQLRSTVEADGFQAITDVYVVKSDAWVSIDVKGGEFPLAKPYAGKWFKVDGKRLAASELALPDGVDLGGAAALLESARRVIRDADGTLRGTVDLRKATNTMVADESAITGLGVQAEFVPFTATLDDQGRLAKLVLDVRGPAEVGTYKIEFTYQDYDSVTPAASPADKATDASPAFYEDILG